MTCCWRRPEIPNEENKRENIQWGEKKETQERVIKAPTAWGNKQKEFVTDLRQLMK
jgi:hypothetical protein